MVWNLRSDRVVGVLWRLAILLLPWQIRWFSEGPTVIPPVATGGINGWPWEQGRLAVYASWIVMAATIVVTSYKLQVSSDENRTTRYGLVGLVLLAVPSLLTLSPRATLQFWLQVGLLAGFVASLVRLRVTREQLATWFVISLVPHVLLAFWQWQTQIVIGTKWLGMSAQNSATLGVSVIEVMGQRILRVYGGFPHPNIFGGWLALAIPLRVWLISRGRSLILNSLFLILFSSALVLTFARGAWIACVVGLVLMIVLSRVDRGRGDCGAGGRGDLAPTDTRRVWAAMSLIVLVVGITAFQTRDLIWTRLQTTPRLEAKSLDERGQGLENGWRLFVEHPLFGVGPGSAILGLSQESPDKTKTPVPPHLVPLLILDEVGIIGLIGLIGLIGFVWRRPFAFGPVAVLLALGLFDHYPWSLWSGQALTAMAVALCLLPEENLKSPPDERVSVR